MDWYHSKSLSHSNTRYWKFVCWNFASWKYYIVIILYFHVSFLSCFFLLLHMSFIHFTSIWSFFSEDMLLTLELRDSALFALWGGSELLRKRVKRWNLYCIQWFFQSSYDLKLKPSDVIFLSQVATSALQHTWASMAIGQRCKMSVHRPNPVEQGVSSNSGWGTTSCTGNWLGKQIN